MSHLFEFLAISSSSMMIGLGSCIVLSHMSQKIKLTVKGAFTSSSNFSSSSLHLWPADVSYVEGVIYDGREVCVYQVRDDLIKITRLGKGHPAFEGGEGKGVFAKVSIPKGTVIGEYSGVFFQTEERPKVCFTLIIFDPLKKGGGGG